MRRSESCAEIHRQCWQSAVSAFAHAGVSLPPEIDFSVGEYPHFKTKRGFAVTFCHDHPKLCTVQVAAKLDRQPFPRKHAILMHELGHCIDHLVPPRQLDALAAENGFSLARLPEQRADDIVEFVWGKRIGYDRDDVQTTHGGTHPRPLHLPR